MKGWLQSGLIPLVLTLVIGLFKMDGGEAVTTTGGPYIMHQPANVTKYDGQKVDFPCVSEAYHNTIIYNWYKDTVDVRTLDGFKAKRISITEDGTLHFDPAVKGDRGWYTCRPSNGLGHDEASAYLNIIYKPEVQKMPSQITWAKGYLQQIDCPVDSNPPLSKVDWVKDSSVVKGTGRFDILGNGTLLVSNVTDGDGGNYQCTPYNSMGNGLPSSRVLVVVKDPPEFTTAPLPLYVRNIGDSVVMECEAFGNPSVSVVWTKVNGMLINNERVTMTEKYLEIRNLTKEDHGTYECKAINTIASRVKVTELRIDNTTPYAPFNVTVIPSVFNVTITWQPAYDGGTFQSYTLWFRQVNHNDWQKMDMPGTSATVFSLYGLHPNAEYEFKILSYNKWGNGSFSDVVRQKTLDYDPLAALSLPRDQNGDIYYPEVVENRGPIPSSPSNLSYQVKDNTIFLYWRVPSFSPAPIFYYLIEYNEISGSNWKYYPERIINAMTSSAIMKGLPSGNYDIRLRSYGVLAKSPLSNTIRVSLPSDDLVLPEALIGGIIGGVLFLLVAVLLALVAIFHSRKKDRKAKSKYNDVNYGKPDEMNGRHEPQTKRDRWQYNGGGDFVTSLDATDGIFFLPQTRALDQSADMMSTRLYVDKLDPQKHSAGRSVPFREGYDQGIARQVPLNETSFMSDRSQAGSFRSRPDKNVTWPDEKGESSLIQQPLSRSLPPSYGRLPLETYPHHEQVKDPLPPPRYPSSFKDYPTLSKSYSFPSHHAPVKPALANQYPSHSAHFAAPRYPSHSGSSPREGPAPNLDTQYPSFQSEDDEVFGTLPQQPGLKLAPGFPRHSSMKPSQMTYLTDDYLPSQQSNVPLFGAEDISSVLEPVSEQTSQSHPNHSVSPADRALYSPRHDTANIPPGYYVSTGDSAKPFAMVTPAHQRRHPSDNESNNSSGRPLGYTRDHLQGVVQRLRQAPPVTPPAKPSRQANISGYSDPLPQSRVNLHLPPQMSKSHSALQDPAYYGTLDSADNSLARRKVPYYMSDIMNEPEYVNEPLRPRALSEGSRGLKGIPSFEAQDYEGAPYVNRPSNWMSYPDMSLPRNSLNYHDGQYDSRNDSGRRPSDERRQYDYRRPADPRQSGHQRPEVPRQYGSQRHLEDSYGRPSSHQQPPSYNAPAFHPQRTLPHGGALDPRGAAPPRYTTQPPHPGGQYRGYPSDESVPQDSGSHSSGIGSRNTSQSNGSVHPHQRGSGGKGSASFSSTHDPDLSLEGHQPSGPLTHRRDTSGDENYEFDSLNALENDIMDDLKRYSRLSGTAGAPRHSHSRVDQHGEHPPGKANRYPDSDQRFQKLREEFKQYRQLQHLPPEEIHPPPTATSALPIGQDGEPLYPMDSEML